MKTLKTGITVLLLSMAVMSGCKKNSENVNDTTSASDLEQSEALSNDVSNIADNVANTGGAGFRMATNEELFNGLGQCATVTHDTVSNPHILTIDFGPTNCLCGDGRYRRGKIIVTYTGHYFQIGTVRTMNFDNFYRNDNKLEGTRTITNNGLDANGQMNWTITGQNMKVTKSNGKIHTWNSTRVRTLLAGANTPTWTDDVYQITGTTNGVNGNGIAYTANITTPLHRALSCKWFDSGVVQVIPDGKPKRILDYGKGACDDQATVKIKNRIHQITLN